VSLVRLRKSVAFDRLLARLFAVAPDRWVLKGGLALDYRLGKKARTTMDIDLAGSGGEDAATADLLATGELDLGDHFSFTIERTEKLDQLVEGSAVRYHVRADLAGRLFEEFLLDVGFDFPTGWEPETLRGPDLLAFADIEPVLAPSLPLELQIAEKVHAYTRGYGRSGIASTRVKDLVDLALIASTSSVDADRLTAPCERHSSSASATSFPGRFHDHLRTGASRTPGWPSRWDSPPSSIEDMSWLPASSIRRSRGISVRPFGSPGLRSGRHDRAKPATEPGARTEVGDRARTMALDPLGD
jgi:hypothetical protein